MSYVAVRIRDLAFGAHCEGVCKITVEDKAHPNKLPFTGTLLLLDTASDKPPHGADGHRIFVPSHVAKRRLDTIIGMALNYKSDLAGHATAHKVGVITGAWIEGNKVKVNGFVWKRDFPEAVRDLRSGAIGMSMELSDVSVRDQHEPVWHLTDFHFSGATALYKSAAAYTATALAAASAVLSVALSGGTRTMPKDAKNDKPAAEGSGKALVAQITAAAGTAAENAVSKAMEGLGATITAAFTEAVKPLATSLDDLRNVVVINAGADLEEIQAKGKRDDDEEMDAGKDEDDMKAGKKDDDDEEMDAGKDEDEDDDLDAALETLEDGEADEEPGEVNEAAENKGDKKTVTKGKMKKKPQPLLASSMTASGIVLRHLHATTRKLVHIVKAERKANKRLVNKIAAMEAQIEAAAEQTDRRSVVPAELTTVLAKSNVDISELRASGQKLSVQDVDQMLSPGVLGHELDVVTRIALKNQMTQMGIMDQGEISRAN